MKKYFALIEKSDLFSDKIIKVSVSYNTLLDHVEKKNINNYDIKEVNYNTYRYLKSTIK